MALGEGVLHEYTEGNSVINVQDLVFVLFVIEGPVSVCMFDVTYQTALTRR